ncbi:MAG TPA: hypothetical protein VF244_02775 [Acidimicrobiales bacterium]
MNRFAVNFLVGQAIVVAFLAAIAMAIGIVYMSADLEAHPRGTPKTCADALGIHWTPEDGATERLNAFDACVAGELRP